MQILNNISLKPFNTFGIAVSAKQFLSIQSIVELKNAMIFVKQNQNKFLILGGGSNILFTNDFDGLVMQINLKGKEIIRQTEEMVLIKVSAGENWHEFVMWSLDQNFAGIENLALIPGNVGSAPIQNIGAYGVEVKDVIECVEVLDLETMEIRKIVKDDCQFGYRDSLFKRSKGKFVIVAVTFNLQKNSGKLNTSYGAIQSELDKNGIKNPTSLDVANAVISIRQSKLPDPKILGNSGSFFKNPIVSKELFESIKSTFPDIPNYPATDDSIKLAAGWLIEQCGFKGKKYGNVGVHEHQALVLVNYGNATGSEVFTLAQTIQISVLEKFGVSIDTEVNIID